MDRLAITQCIKIIKTYFKNFDFATTTYRALLGKQLAKERRDWIVTARFAENIGIVSENVVEDPNVSFPRRSQELGLSYSIL